MAKPTKYWAFDYRLDRKHLRSVAFHDEETAESAAKFCYDLDVSMGKKNPEKPGVYEIDLIANLDKFTDQRAKEFVTAVSERVKSLKKDREVMGQAVAEVAASSEEVQEPGIDPNGEQLLIMSD